MANGKFVGYYRVSTDKQGKSGLGLEAQKAAVLEYLNGGKWALLAEFVEVESGKNNDRPKLAKAMQHCRLTGATLVIAKLDRLSRDAHFLLGLQKAEVEFVCADMPEANRLTIGLLAVVAQHEREQTSSRTKAALAVAKARGTVLGGYRGVNVDGRLGGAARRENANAFAAEVAPIIAPMFGAGMSYARVAAALTDQGISTARGGAWTAMQVKRIADRTAA